MFVITMILDNFKKMNIKIILYLFLLFFKTEYIVCDAIQGEYESI